MIAVDNNRLTSQFNQTTQEETSDMIIVDKEKATSQIE